MTQHNTKNNSKSVVRFALLGGGIAVVIAITFLIIDSSGNKTTTQSRQTSGSVTTLAPSTTRTPNTSSAPTSTSTVAASTTTNNSSVPLNFAPSSASFVNGETGYVLGGVPCASSTNYCAELTTTSNGGQNFTGVSVNNVTIASKSAIASESATPNSVSKVHFVTTQLGYIFDPGLYITTNGGSSFAPVVVPGLNQIGSGFYASNIVVSGTSVTALLVPANTTGQNHNSTLISASISTPSEFVTLNTASPIASNEILMGNSYGSLLVSPSASSPSISYLGATATAWQSLSPSCLSGTDQYGTPAIAGATIFSSLSTNSTPDLAVACTLGVGAGSSSKQLDISENTGSTWNVINTLPNPGIINAIAASSSTNIAVAASSGETWIYTTSNGGNSWSIFNFGGTTLASEAMPVNDLGYFSATNIYAILGSVGDVNKGSVQSELYISHDAGISWTPVIF